VGNLSPNGFYTAPPTIAQNQTVTITATSKSNPFDMTTATIQLLPTVSTLREIAAMRGVLMGSAADGAESGGESPLVYNPRYSSTLADQYDMLEGENAMKWYIIGAQQGTYDFEYGDALVSFAQAHGMKTRGHNLCWNQQNPAWLSTLSSSELYQTLHDYIFATMGHYKGQVFAWDVVNEAIANNATGVGTTMSDSIWYNQPGIGLSGTGYVEQAFRWARAADPTAKLFYNDHGTEITGNKSQALLNMLKDFLSRGVPIDGVGLEMHVDTTTNYPATFPATLKAYTDLGLEVHITEMDVRLPVNADGVASAADLQTQAATYSFIVNTCLQNPRCTAIQTWGFTDEWSWIPKEYPGFGAALPFDKNYVPKPAFNSILSALQTLTQ
jgi:endo-1,4-beta-xylanase